MTTITGNTYPVKDAIKALGGRWNKARQGWDVPDDKADEARELVAQAGPAEVRPRYRARAAYGSNYALFQGGAEVYTNRRGRCEDAPCCGCCS